jgi:hypothetical protein
MIMTRFIKARKKRMAETTRLWPASSYFSPRSVEDSILTPMLRSVASTTEKLGKTAPKRIAPNIPTI